MDTRISVGTLARSPPVFPAISYQGQIWILGGAGERSAGTSDGGIWRSADGREWNREATPAPWLPAAGHSAVVFAGQLWVFDKSIWSSADGREWDQVVKSAPWNGQVFTTATVYRGKMWVMGGFLFDQGTQKNIWCSEDGKHWTRVSSSAPWSPRSQICCAAWNNRLWVVAGGPDADARGIWHSEDAKRWEKVSGTPDWQIFGGHSVLSFHDQLWIVGGGGDGKVNGAWSSDDGLNWHYVSPTPGWSPRRFHASVVHDDRIWLLGGQGTIDYGHEGDFIRSAVDQRGDYAYFFPRGTVSRAPRALKVKLTDGDELPKLAGMVSKDAAEVQSAIAFTERRGASSGENYAVDSASGNSFTYFFTPAPGRVVIRKAGKQKNVLLPPRDGYLRASGCVVADPDRGYIYVGTARGPAIPAEIVKIAVGNDETDPHVVGVERLREGECNLSCAILDQARGMVYFGANTEGGATIVKLTLGEGSAPPQRTGALALPEGVRDLRTCVFDGRRTAYFATRDTILKVALGDNSAPPTLVGSVKIEMPTALKNDVWWISKIVP